ncbi:hypothetical protein FWH13_03220 [Candidatus Saccharibacteria bacterium]|nr:hypothetical protein [Candidatus Saccharibacteria bacterium]
MATSRQRLEEREVQVINAPTSTLPLETLSVDDAFFSLRRELEAMIAPSAAPTTRIDRVRAGAISNLRRLLNHTLSGDAPERTLSLGQISTIGTLVNLDDDIPTLDSRF